MKRSRDGTFVLDSVKEESDDKEQKQKKEQFPSFLKMRPKNMKPLTLKSPPRKRPPTVEDIVEEFLEGITIGTGFINQIKRFMRGF